MGSGAKSLRSCCVIFAQEGKPKVQSPKFSFLSKITGRLQPGFQVGRGGRERERPDSVFTALEDQEPPGPLSHWSESAHVNF